MEGGLTKMKVWVNGTFDVMHIGHIRLLEYANSFGMVKVGLDTDERVSIKKGKDRPFNNLKDRMDFIQSIRYVESVTFFGSDEELEQRIKEYEPDIIVIGKEYQYKRIIGQEYVEKIMFFDRIDNKSTTKILNNEYNSNR
jgi:D-beta-D-heptose 7-phosphate kinase/D-beta-D-heptose 1-phosphate adenosyltransferase